MKRYFVMILLAACLLLPALSGEARAADSGEYTVNGRFCYRDVDGELKPIPYARAILELLKANGTTMDPRYDGSVENGKLTLPVSTNTIVYGNYQLTLSFDKVSPVFPLSCGSDGKTIPLLENGEPLGNVEMDLHLSIPTVVKDGSTGAELTEGVRYALKAGENIPSMGSISSSSWLSLPWARCQLALSADGYQSIAYNLCPVMGSDGMVFLDGVADPASLRMLPEGSLVQPTPTNVRYAGGIVYWSANFVAPGDDTTDYMRFCEISLTNLSTGTGDTVTMSCNNSGSYDLFSQQPDWPSGDYVARITALARPYVRETYDSDPAIFYFHYDQPKGYLPSVQKAGWLEDDFPAMTWEFPSDLLSNVKEFRVIPRVADSPDGWGRDFVHEYLGDEWQGHLSVAPSQDAVYRIPRLMDAVRAYGEGWYYFEVNVISNSEMWRNSQGSTFVSVPFHYVPDPKEPIKNGTLVSASGSRVKWTLDNQLRTLTVTSPIPEQESVLVASYDGKGRFLGAQTVRPNRSLNLSQADGARMFWVEKETFLPQARSSAILPGTGLGI